MGDALHTAGGVTDAKEARLAQGGLLAVQGATILDARTGVLAGPGSTALVTGTSATGPMTVQIAPHVAVTSRGSANGPYLGPVLEAATTVTIAAAPASNSRIDVVYAKQQDGNSGVPSPDVATAPLYGVLQGTSAASPVKPSLSAIVGAEELATVQVAAGATSTNGAGVTITQTAKQTVARGARVPVRNQSEQDALTAFPGLEVYRLDTGQVQVCASTGPTVWATTYDPGAWTSYAPTWTSSGAVQPAVGGGSLIGKYSKTGRVCEVDICLTWGSAFNGGTGDWVFTLPFTAASGREMEMSVKTFCAAGNYAGVGYILAGSNAVHPQLPASASSSAMQSVRNADGTAAAGTGIPQAPGAFTFSASGHTLVIFGRYETAS